MRIRLLSFPFRLAITLLMLAAFGCAPKLRTDPQYEPAVDILEIVKDFQRLAGENLYRFPIPKDVTGVNIMKATLARLEDYERKHPNRFSDFILFSKGMAYERLRDYDQAIRHYRRVARSNTQLGNKARKSLEVLQAFQRIIQKPLPRKDPFEYIKALDEKVEAWHIMVKKHEGTSYEFLARVEEEKIDRAKVAFVEINRYRLKDGNQLVILGYSQLVSKHQQSKNVQRYLLDFGDFYLKLANEYTAQNDPETTAFEWPIYKRLVKSALKLYTEIAQQDGIQEKIEAKGKIETLQASIQKIRRLSR